MKRRKRISPLGFWPVTVLLIMAAIFFWFSIPDPLFHDPLSTVIYDRQGDIAGAHISDDGQWRFPVPDSVPGKFSSCIRLF
ncbi:MAG TPA: hypothetical protein VE870_12545, partial [Bacteroidales bacterium]|nr:hypothetical protein [Bacteroidales bacterium]